MWLVLLVAYLTMTTRAIHTLLLQCRYECDVYPMSPGLGGDPRGCPGLGGMPVRTRKGTPPAHTWGRHHMKGGWWEKKMQLPAAVRPVGEWR